MSLQHDIESLALYKAHFGSVRQLRLNGTLLEDIKSSPEVRACAKCVIEQVDDILKATTRMSQITPLLFTASGIGGGYAAAKLINTNRNPSALKTSATVLAASFAQLAVTTGGGYALSPHLHIQEMQAACAAASTDAEAMAARINNLSPEEHTQLLNELGVTKAQLDQIISHTFAALAGLTAAIFWCVAVNFTSSIVGAVHGYKRSGGLGALGFFLAGTPGLGVAMAQGFAEPLSNVEEK